MSHDNHVMHLSSSSVLCESVFLTPVYILIYYDNHLSCLPLHWMSADVLILHTKTFSYLVLNIRSYFDSTVLLNLWQLYFYGFICVIPVYMYLLKLSFVDVETIWMSMATNGLHSNVIMYVHSIMCVQE